MTMVWSPARFRSRGRPAVLDEEHKTRSAPTPCQQSALVPCLPRGHLGADPKPARREVGTGESVEQPGAGQHLVAQSVFRGVQRSHPRLHSVVEREDVIPLCLTPPQRTQPIGQRRVFAGQVTALGEVGAQVVELPVVAVEVVARLVRCDGLPATAVDASVPRGLEVLHRSRRGRVRLGKRVHHRGAMDRQLLDPPILLGRRHAAQLVDRGGDVDHMVELVPVGARTVQARGPVHQ